MRFNGIECAEKVVHKGSSDFTSDCAKAQTSHPRPGFGRTCFFMFLRPTFLGPSPRGPLLHDLDIE